MTEEGSRFELELISANRDRNLWRGMLAYGCACRVAVIGAESKIGAISAEIVAFAFAQIPV